MNFKSTLFAAAAVVSLGTTVSAATVEDGGSIAIGDIGIGNGTTAPGESNTFTFTAETRLKILDFVSISSNGFNDGDDLALVDFGYSFSSGDPGDDGSYSNFIDNGVTTIATASLPGFSLAAGESFTFFFDYDAAGSQTTTNQFNFVTAAVPIPAAGLLLLGGLGGLAFARRRKAA